MGTSSLLPDPDIRPQIYDLTPRVVSIMVAALGRADWTGAHHLADVDLAMGPMVINRARLMMAQSGPFLSFHCGPAAPRVEFMDPNLAELAREAAMTAFEILRRSTRDNPGNT